MAIDIFKRNRMRVTEIDLGLKLNKANYLIVISPDEVITSPGKNKGDVIIEKGSVLKFLFCINEKGEKFLPAFTDWDEINAWTKDKVNAINMSARELWGFVMSDNHYFGIAINPGGSVVTLRRENIKALIEDRI